MKKSLQKAAIDVRVTFPVAKLRFAESLCVSVFTINKIWQRFCEKYTEAAYPTGGGTHGKLANDDLELIEVLKK